MLRLSKPTFVQSLLDDESFEERALHEKTTKKLKLDERISPIALVKVAWAARQAEVFECAPTPPAPSPDVRARRKRHRDASLLGGDAAEGDRRRRGPGQHADGRGRVGPSPP